MSGNTFGKLFTITTCGESHGAGYACIVDGCPPGMELSEEDLQKDLDRRKPGKSRHVTQRKETDLVRIISGVFEGVTTGTPIGLLIDNTDQKSKDYAKINDLFRPGHADYTYQQKYGIKYLKEKFGIIIRGYLSQIGPIEIEFKDWNEVENNAFFCPDPARVDELDKYMDALRKEGDSIGARINVVAENVPPGLGEPVFDRFDADIAKAIMSINAVKGVEIGAGFNSINEKGTEHRDEMTPEGFIGNHAGGVLGGISSGQDVLVSMALKPTSSIRLPGQTVNVQGDASEVKTTGRHDPCVGIRATPIAEAMLALVIMDHVLRHRGQNADVQSITPVVPASVKE